MVHNTAQTLRTEGGRGSAEKLTLNYCKEPNAVTSSCVAVVEGRSKESQRLEN